MSDIISQNDGFSFLSNTIRPDGMVSATALTTAYRNTTGVRKDVRDWLKTPSAGASIAYLERVTSIPVTALVIAEHGVGTWIHPKLAPILAMWISPEFQFAVVDLIEAKMNPPVVQPELPQRQLAPQRDLIDYMQVIERFEYLTQDPLIKSLVAQRLAEELGSKALPSTVVTQVVLTVRAGELGYCQRQIGSGAQLGKFVHQMIQPTGKTQHGKYPVNVYELTEELDDCIHAYFR